MAITQPVLPPRLPPGSLGLPVVGESLAFATNSFAFLAKRYARFGPIFRTHILGHEMIVLVGPDAWHIYGNPAFVRRDQGILAVQQLFGGTNFGMLEGPDHTNIRALVLAALSHDALAAYLPNMQEQIETALTSWVTQPELRLAPALKRLAVTIIATNILGLPPGPRLGVMLTDLDAIWAGAGALPINLPGTTFHRALEAVTRLLAGYDLLIRERRSLPQADGLSRMLAATSNGRTLTDTEARVELQHIFIAGNIVYTHLTNLILQLSQHPDILAKLAAEVGQVATTPAVTLEQIYAMPYLQQVLLEIKRTTPVLPAIFTRAVQTFEYNGYTVPQGSIVLMGLYSSHFDPAIWTDPTRFDPERFGPERAEDQRHPFAMTQQGAGPHACAGYDYSTVIAAVFATLLVRGYTWVLPPQRLAYRWSIPPEPRDGLRATIGVASK